MFDAEFWVAVSFAIFVIAIFKPIKRLILQALNQRENSIREEFKYVDDLKHQASDLLADNIFKSKSIEAQIKQIEETCNQDSIRLQEYYKNYIIETINAKSAKMLAKLAAKENQITQEMRADIINRITNNTASFIMNNPTLITHSRLIKNSLEKLSNKIN